MHEMGYKLHPLLDLANHQIKPRSNTEYYMIKTTEKPPSYVLQA
jgi:hypothetical protein